MLNVETRGFLYRFVAAFAGLAMISMGAIPFLRTGDLLYLNWFGGLVFAPWESCSGSSRFSAQSGNRIG
jgi:hypothetical protein